MKTMKYTPLMTVAEFAVSVGVSEGVVTGWVKRGYVPTLKIGRHRLVNVAQLNEHALNHDNSLTVSALPNENDTLKFSDKKQNTQSTVQPSISKDQRKLFERLPNIVKKNIIKDFGSATEAFKQGMVIKGKEATFPNSPARKL